MAAVGTEDAVAVIEMEADTGGDGFLSDIGVTGSVNQPLLVAPCEFFFSLTNQLHGAVERENLIGHGREPLCDWKL
jgi:calcineurin-like phosphoesterase